MWTPQLFREIKPCTAQCQKNRQPSVTVQDDERQHEGAERGCRRQQWQQPLRGRAGLREQRKAAKEAALAEKRASAAKEKEARAQEAAAAAVAAAAARE